MAGTALVFDILAKDRASKEFGKVGRSIDDVHDRGMKMGGGLKKVAFGIAGAFAGIQIGGFLKGAVEEAAESAKIGRVTEQTIKATGAAAKVTADQVGALATSLSNKTAVDDELVQTGANLLLTFKNIRNEAGKNNNIFDKATAAALDLSAGGFGSVESASVMLGKALNDPIKGVTALGRVGVTFTQQQKDQIKTLVESNDILGAQKVILGEVESQVGGLAEASADPMKKLQVQFGNLKESIGGALLPVITRLATFASGTLLPAFGKIGEAFRLVLGDDGAQGFAEVMDSALGNSGKFVGFFRTVGDGIRQLVFGFRAFYYALKDGDVTSDGFVGAMETLAVIIRNHVWPAIKTLAGFLTSTVIPALGAMAGFVARNKDFFVPFGAALVVIISVMKAWAAVQAVINVLLAANPIGLVVIALAALVAGLVWAYKNSETFRDIVQGAFAGVMATVKALQVAFAAAMAFIVSVLNGGGGRIGEIIRSVAAFFAERIQSMLNIARGVVNIIVGVFTGDFGRIRDGVSQAVGGVLSLVTQIPRLILNALGNLGGLLYNAGADVIRGLINGITSKIGDIGRAMSQVTDKISRFLPGSPVREGPLKVLNNGYAGRQIAQMIAGGVEAGRPAVASAIGGLSGTATASVGVDGLSTQVAGRSGGGVTINIHGPTDPAGAARAVRDELLKLKRSGMAVGLA